MDSHATCRCGTVTHKGKAIAGRHWVVYKGLEDVQRGTSQERGTLQLTDSTHNSQTHKWGPWPHNFGHSSKTLRHTTSQKHKPWACNSLDTSSPSNTPLGFTPFGHSLSGHTNSQAHILGRTSLRHTTLHSAAAHLDFQTQPYPQVQFKGHHTNLGRTRHAPAGPGPLARSPTSLAAAAAAAAAGSVGKTRGQNYGRPARPHLQP